MNRQFWSINLENLKLIFWSWGKIETLWPPRKVTEGNGNSKVGINLENLKIIFWNWWGNLKLISWKSKINIFKLVVRKDWGVVGRDDWVMTGWPANWLRRLPTNTIQKQYKYKPTLSTNTTQKQYKYKPTLPTNTIQKTIQIQQIQFKCPAEIQGPLHNTNTLPANILQIQTRKAQIQYEYTVYKCYTVK